jgi:hypothetical protein
MKFPNTAESHKRRIPGTQLYEHGVNLGVIDDEMGNSLQELLVKSFELQKIHTLLFPSIFHCVLYTGDCEFIDHI